jgi:hypothetical protein
VQRVYMRGCAVTISWADSTRSLTDLIFDGVSRCLGDAGIAASDVEAVVLAAHDLVDGRGLTNMVTAPAAGAYLKDETRLADDGAAAFILGDARVRSGSMQTCLVASWGRASEGPVDEVAHALFDPFTTRPLALTEIAVSALRASKALAVYPGYGEDRSRAGDRRAQRPLEPERTPRTAWPLRERDLPVWADIVSAVVLTAVPGPTEVLGVGMSTEPYEIGDRDLLGFPALRSASAQALRSAARRVGDVGIFELDGLTLFDEALAAEAVGAAPTGGGMALLADRNTVNPDGGSSAGYCAPSMGLVRISRAYQRLFAAGAGTALATGSSVVASQTQSAVVLGRA